MKVIDDPYYNIGGVIADIEGTGECDEVCLRSLKRVEKKIAELQKEHEMFRGALEEIAYPHGCPRYKQIALAALKKADDNEDHNQEEKADG